MADENIFSGLKVVDLASFIAGPGAATMLSAWGGTCQDCSGRNDQTGICRQVEV
jgi:hypothetical protein